MKTNRTPFTDLCELITVSYERDADGYRTETEKASRVFCSVCNGVSRAEFYEAAKTGMKLAITVEVWENELERATKLRYNGQEYNIVRTYPTGHGTLELTCSEVVR